MLKAFRHFPEIRKDPVFPYLVLFGIEGFLLQFACSINGFANNLYATNLQATDNQIGLISLIPNLVACLVLLPFGILADRMKSAKTLPVIMLLFSGISYFAFGTVPVLGTARMVWFFVFLTCVLTGIALYNAQWQALFAGVVQGSRQNRIYTFRNSVIYFISIFAPVLCGSLLSSFPDTEGKLWVLRIFYYLSGVSLLIQAWVVSRIPETPAEKEDAGKKPTLRVQLRFAAGVFSSKSFLCFLLPVLFFYMTWHLDWSMWYIGQTQYCHMNEAQLSIINAVFNIGQLLTMAPLAKLVRKKTPDFVIVLSAAGLNLCPVLITFTSLLGNACFPVFTVLLPIINMAQGIVGLCILQMMLKVIPEKNRNIMISIYTLVITLSNSFLPYLGVQLYTALGADRIAFYRFNMIAFGLRLMAVTVLVFRYLYLKKNNLLKYE